MAVVSRIPVRPPSATPVSPDVSRLTPTQVGGLNAAQVKALSIDNIRRLSTAQIAAFNPAAVTGLTAVQADQMTATQIAAFTPQQLRSFTPGITATLSADEMAMFSTAQVGALSAGAAKGLGATVLASLNNTQLGGLSSTAVGSLSTTQLRALSAGQIAAFSATQVSGLGAPAVNTFTPAQLAALRVGGLSSGAAAGLTSTTATRLSTTQLQAMTGTQIGALSTTAASALSSTQVAALSSAQLAAMKSTMVGEAGGLRINLVWGASTSKAPAAFRHAAITAARSLTEQFSNVATVNIQMGYGEANGRKIDRNAVAQTINRGSFTTYATIRDRLLTDADNSEFEAAADASLAQNDPTRGARFVLNTAHQKALGLLAPESAAIDGYVGLSSTLAMDYSQTGAAGTYDAIGALQHEFSEVLGRTGSVGRAFGANIYTTLDLYRYSATAGGPARALTAGPASAYFSIDGGATNLGAFNPANGRADVGDWNETEAGDAYGYGMAGVRSGMPARDTIVMAAIGYNLTATGLGRARGTITDTRS